MPTMTNAESWNKAVDAAKARGRKEFEFAPGSGLEIGSYFVPIEYVEGLKEGSEECLGTYESNPPTIRIEHSLTGRTRTSTLFHEALHHIDEHYHLELGESGVSVLEDQLALLVRKNPEFMQAWMARCGENT